MTQELAKDFTQADAAKFLYRLVCDGEADARHKAAMATADYTARGEGLRALQAKYDAEDYGVGGFCPIPEGYSDTAIKRLGEASTKAQRELLLWVKTRDFVVEHFLNTFASNPPSISEVESDGEEVEPKM